MFRLTRQRSHPVESPPPRRHPVLACPVCGSDRFCPIEWETAGDRHWSMLLHCGECQAWVQGTVCNEHAAAFDIDLDRQEAEIARALASLEIERMAVYVETFTAALEHDLVDADDFAR